MFVSSAYGSSANPIEICMHVRPPRRGVAIADSAVAPAGTSDCGTMSPTTLI